MELATAVWREWYKKQTKLNFFIMDNRSESQITKQNLPV